MSNRDHFMTSFAYPGPGRGLPIMLEFSQCISILYHGGAHRCPSHTGESITRARAHAVEKESGWKKRETGKRCQSFRCQGLQVQSIPPVLTDALYASQGTTGKVRKARNFRMPHRVHPVGNCQ